ncbi:hypothetical protein ACR42D_15865 [Desulfovibrio caledoniensis]
MVIAYLENNIRIAADGMNCAVESLFGYGAALPGEREGDRREPPHIPFGARYFFEGEMQAVFEVGAVFPVIFPFLKTKKHILTDFLVKTIFYSSARREGI